MSHLTPDQCRALFEVMRSHVGWLVRLRERMERGGRTSDPLYAQIMALANAAQDLYAAVHYRSVRMGTGEPAGLRDVPSTG